MVFQRMVKKLQTILIKKKYENLRVKKSNSD